ncbi:MAG: hypothetical protein RLZZ15_2641 [Verrucomicrobiota bacterium]|jgi:hypothetical protein
MPPAIAEEIESRFATLPAAEQVAVLARLEQRVGRSGAWAEDLRAMADDPQMRAELGRIEAEFRPTETDGLALT